MFERADRLVGIYKVNDQTRSITIDPNTFVVPGGDNGERAAAGKKALEEGEEAGEENAKAGKEAQVSKAVVGAAAGRMPLAMVN